MRVNLLPGSDVVKVPTFNPMCYPLFIKETETIAHAKKQTTALMERACLSRRPSLDQSYERIFDNLSANFTDYSLTLQRSKGMF